MRMGRTAMLAALLVSVAVPSAADDPEPPRLSARLGVGLATPFDGDLPFTARAWQASARAAVSRHFLIEGFYGEWRHSTSHVTTNTVVHGPVGVLGQVDRVTQRTEYVTPEVGFNVLAAGSVGRVAFSAGGGPGVLLYRRHFIQTFEGCHGEVRCSDMDTRFSSGSFSVQATASVDVAVFSRIGVFGECRIAVPLEDVGAGHSAVIGGLRVSLW